MDWGKKHVVLLESGDHAIMEALKIAKKAGKTRVLLQDQGGWLTCKDYARKLGLSVVELKTDDGYLEHLTAKRHDVVLLNSMPGYACLQDNINELYAAAKKTGALFVNDCSGSVGTEIAKVGDILVCSFGKDKPINLHYGGCIAYDEEYNVQQTFDQDRLQQLQEEIDRLPQRLIFLSQVHDNIIPELDGDVVHKDKRGINVIVRFNTEEEKQRIISYCNQKNYPYTVCPRYIRILDNAISIEVKRLQNNKS